jgi:hypothetical protein
MRAFFRAFCAIHAVPLYIPGTELRSYASDNFFGAKVLAPEGGGYLMPYPLTPAIALVATKPKERKPDLNFDFKTKMFPPK